MALQRDVDKWIGDHAHTGLLHQWQELTHIVVVHAVHGGEMRTHDAALQAQPLRFEGQSFYMALEWIIGFVAMHVHHQTAFSGKLAKQLYAECPILHRALKMRDTANDIYAFVERAFEIT